MYMSTYLGIDTSARSTGVAVLTLYPNLPPTLDTFKIITKSYENDALRLLKLHTSLPYGPFDGTALEGPSLGSTHQADKLGMFRGVAMVHCVLHASTSPLVVAPSTLKKWATGMGFAKKEQMLESLNKVGLGTVSGHDEADAGWLAILVAAVMGDWVVAKTRARLGAVEAIDAQSCRPCVLPCGRLPRP